MKVSNVMLAGGGELQEIVETYELMPKEGAEHLLKDLFEKIESLLEGLTDKAAAYAKVKNCLQGCRERRNRLTNFTGG